MLHLDHVREALARHRPELLPPEPGGHRAAVALVLAGDPADLHLCLIRRAESPHDPWSGHMALPGGRVDPWDPTVQAAAERETAEEVGLVIQPEQLLGTLSDLPVRRRGLAGLTLSGFVYYAGPEPPVLIPNHEVAAAHWLPLTHLWDAEQATHHPYMHEGERLHFPGIRVGVHVIWGLTFRVLSLFSDVLDHPLPHLEDVPGLRL